MQSDKTTQMQSEKSLNGREKRIEADLDKSAEFLAELNFLERRACWRGSYGHKIEN